MSHDVGVGHRCTWIAEGWPLIVGHCLEVIGLYISVSVGFGVAIPKFKLMDHSRPKEPMWAFSRGRIWTNAEKTPVEIRRKLTCDRKIDDRAFLCDRPESPFHPPGLAGAMRVWLTTFP